MRKKMSFGAVLFMLAVLVFMYLPVLVVVLYSFNANEARNAMSFTGFTFSCSQPFLFRMAIQFPSAFLR